MGRKQLFFTLFLSLIAVTFQNCGNYDSQNNISEEQDDFTSSEEVQFELQEQDSEDPSFGSKTGSRPSKVNISINSLFSDTLPPHIPKQTKNSKHCFTDKEIESIRLYPNKQNSKAETVSVPFCSKRFLKPITLINANSYYTKNSYGSTFDCKRYRKNKGHSVLRATVTKELTQFLDSTLAPEIPTNKLKQNAKCASSILLLWAKKRSFVKISKGSDYQGKFTQMWLTASIGSLYTKYQSVLDKGFSTNKEKMIVRKWITTLGDYVLKEASKYSTHPKYSSANMQFWRGYALLAASVASNKFEHIKMSRKIFKKALSEITNAGSRGLASEKGYLPHELERGSRAQGYHAFALKPILGMASLSKVINCEFIDSDKDLWSIAILFRKTIEGQRNKKVFENAVLKYTDLNISKKEAIQSSIAYVDHLMALLGDTEDSVIIQSRMDPYLKVKGIRRNSPFQKNPKYLFDYKFGGDMSLIPFSKAKLSKSLQKKCSHL